MNFIEFNNKIVNTETISCITLDCLVPGGFVHVHFMNGEMECVEGREAVEIVMRLCPSSLEGRRLKFLKYRWAIHNLVGHPLMQLLSWLGLRSWGLWVHDATIPNPKVLHEQSK